MPLDPSIVMQGVQPVSPVNLMQMQQMSNQNALAQQHMIQLQ